MQKTSLQHVTAESLVQTMIFYLVRQRLAGNYTKPVAVVVRILCQTLRSLVVVDTNIKIKNWSVIISYKQNLPYLNNCPYLTFITCFYPPGAVATTTGVAVLAIVLPLLKKNNKTRPDS